MTRCRPWSYTDCLWWFHTLSPPEPSFKQSTQLKWKLGMWINVWLTKHRLQSQASDIKVHNRWLNVNSSTYGPSFIARWSYRVTQTVAHAVMKAMKLNILFTETETTCKLKASCMGERNAKRDTRCGGGQVCSFVNCVRQSAAIQRTRHSNDLVM